MDQCSVFVDAGYLLAAGAELCFGEKTKRHEFTCKYEDLAALVVRLVVQHGKLPLLRVYWYDAGRNNQPDFDQRRIGALPSFKLRLGRLSSRGEQKGVDSLIIRDLMTLSRERVMSAAYLIAGDEDLREAVVAAQDLGVRVILIGVPPDVDQNQAPTLVQEADEHILLLKNDLSPCFARRTLSPMQHQRSDPTASPAGVATPPPSSSDSAAGTSSGSPAEMAPSSVGNPTDAELELIARTAHEFAETWAGSVSADRILAVLGESPKIPQELYRELGDITSAALDRRIPDLPPFARPMRAEFWRTLRGIGRAVLRSAEGPPGGVTRTHDAGTAQPPVGLGRAVSPENDEPIAEAVEDPPQKRSRERAEGPSPSEPLYSDMPNPDELVLIERIARECAEAWARSAEAEQVQTILREASLRVNPTIPRELDRRLLITLSTALGRRVLGSAFSSQLRVACRSALRQLGNQVAEPSAAPSAEAALTASTEPSRPSSNDGELESPSLASGVPSAASLIAPPATPARRSRAPRKVAPPRKPAKARPKTAAAASQKTAAEIEREAEDYVNDPYHVAVPGDEAVMAAVVRMSEEDAARLAANEPKLVKCRDCGKDFPFPYDVYMYYSLLWQKTKTAEELAHCGPCRKQTGRKTFKEELPDFGPFQYDPEGSQSARELEPRASAESGDLVRESGTSTPGVKDAGARPPTVTAHRRTAEEIDREADECLADPGRWEVPIDEAVADELVKAAIRRKATDARLTAAACSENPKLLECRDCGKYFAFPYVIRIYRDLIWSGRRTAVELAHCVACRKQKGMKTFEAEMPGLGPALYDPGDSQVALARGRELSDARTHELSAAWASGELVKERARPPVAVRQKTPEEIEREAEEYFADPDSAFLVIEDEAVAAAVSRMREEFSARLNSNDPKSLLCRDCKMSFPFPYAFSVYYSMVWTRTKTAEELAHCKTCRAQKGMKTFEEELPGQGPFKFAPVVGM